MIRVLTLAMLLPGLAGCSWFGDKDTSEPPAELVKFKSTLNVRKLWSAKVGDGTEFLRLGLTPATDGSRIYAAAHDGNVVAVDAESGSRVWLVKSKLPLAAGPGVGEGLVAVGSSDGDLLLLDAATGSERWRRELSSEILAAPTIAQGMVLVRTVDGRLRALSAQDGSEIWLVEQSVPRLSLRGNAPPVLAGSVVLAGFDNGTLAAVSLQSGETLWEVTVSPPTGRTELAKLADVDAAVQVVGNDAYVAGFQGRVGMVAVESGRLMWTREVSSYGGLGVDWNNVYVTDDESGVVALRRSNGGELWRTDVFRLRSLTAPVPFGATIVVGDYEGYLHWLDPESGTLLARTRADRSTISNPPIVVGEALYVLTDGGTLSAYRVVPRRG